MLLLRLVNSNCDVLTRLEYMFVYVVRFWLIERWGFCLFACFA